MTPLIPPSPEAAPAEPASMREVLDVLETVTRHFTRARSTLKDSRIRGLAHDVLKRARATPPAPQEAEPAETVRADAARWNMVKWSAAANPGALPLTWDETDATKGQWLRSNHAWWLLKKFPSPRPYVDAIDVIDDAIDAAMSTTPSDTEGAE